MTNKTNANYGYLLCILAITALSGIMCAVQTGNHSFFVVTMLCILVAPFLVGDWVDSVKPASILSYDHELLKKIDAEIDKMLGVNGIASYEKPQKPKSIKAEKPKKRPASKKPVVPKRVRSVPKKD